MTLRHPRRPAMILWSITAILALFTVVLELGIGPIDDVAVWYVGPIIMLLFFQTIGALVASRRPENPLGWVLCAVGVSLAIWVFSDAYVRYTRSVRPLPAQAWMGTLANLQVFPAFLTLFTVVCLLFPTGRLLSRRWRPLAWIAAGFVTAIVIHQLVAVKFVADGAYPNPLYLPMLAHIVPPIQFLAFIVGGVTLLGSLLSLVLRLRRSHGVERQQLKWFAYAAAMAITAMLCAGVIEALDPENQAGLIGTAFWAIALLGMAAGIPAAIGIAILRYRLYDIDRIINRTLVYTILTAILAGTDLLLVLTLERLLQPVASGSDLVVAGSTLAVAALIRPLRSHVQSIVDRRFYRHKYDATRTLEVFSARLRDEIDLDALTAALQATVVETMQPAHVSLWLRDITSMPEARMRRG